MMQDYRAASAADGNANEALMLFAIETLARKALSSSSTPDMRAERCAYIRSFGTSVLTAGDLLADDGRTVIGSLVIVNADDLATAHAFAREEPSARAGLMQSITIKPWRAMPIMPYRRYGASV